MTKAEKTRQFIIEKTAPVFNKNGYAGTSIADLTEATGLTKGSIYGNFENKDAVAIAAFEYNHAKISGLVAARVADAKSAIDKLKAHTLAFGELYKNPTLQFGCPILNTATEADDTHPELRGKVVKAIESWYHAVERIIKEGQENKEIVKKLDAHEFAGAFIAIIEGGVMLWKVTGKSEGLQAALKQARKMISEIKR
jgi:TetR/AcrR family transcriptional regulator, transcriptional repressor for nem operon